MQTAKDKLFQTLVNYVKRGEDLGHVSISKIAQDADIGKSTVYEYFTSKDEMIVETYRYLLKHYESILFHDLEVMDFKGALLEELKRTLMVMKDARSVMEVIMNQSHHQTLRIDIMLKPEIQAIQKAMEKRFSHIMYLGVVEGIFPVKEPKKTTTYVIRALITGLMFQYINDELDMTEDELLHLIYDEIVRTISS